MNSWWEGVVIVNQNKNKFSRRVLILEVADTDGGAHVDRFLKQPYIGLTRENSVGITLNTSILGNRVSSQEVENLVPSTIRQIAFEVLKTLEEVFPSLSLKMKSLLQ